MPNDNYRNLIPLPADDDTLIPRSEVPRYLPIAVQTLAKMACTGGGAPFIKIGRRVVYRAGDLRQWLSERTYTSTTEATIKANSTHQQQGRAPPG
jgi:hypothetical protein